MRGLLQGSLLIAVLATPAGAAPQARAAARPVLQADPRSVTLDGPRAEQQLLITALYPDGRRLDVTRQVSYRSGAAWLRASAGRVWALNDGRTDLRLTLTAPGGAPTALSVPVTSRNSQVHRPVSFVNEVVPALTLAGCNQGACHGGQFGRGGLRLSLLGFDPDSDYRAITRDGGGRRIARTEPGHSLLLLKATMTVPHGGGRRLSPGSPALVILRDWLANGAPGPVPGEAGVVRLTVEPSERLLQRGQAQQVRVTATYSDGATRDVTRLARYTSGNEAIASVDAAGLVHGGASGAAPVMMRFQGQAAVARIAVPFGRSLPAVGGAPAPGNLIDAQVEREWRRLGLSPSAPATDAEFLRRASLDLTGALPTPERLERFLSDGGSSPAARERLVDELLASPRWVDFWTLYFGDLFRNTQKNLGEKGMWAFHSWIRASLRDDKPYNQMVREMIAGHGSAARDGAANFYGTAKGPEELAETTAQVFLGVRLQCARCHNHPFEKWTQADYYHLAAFFAGVKRKQSGEEMLVLHTAEGTVTHPRTGEVMVPQPPDGPARAVSGEDRPTALAEWLADPANPFVARSIVNRVWARLMGRGLIDPVDDVRVSNPATHPALLDALTRDFIQHKFSLRHLMRVIATSRAYGLSSLPTAGNGKDEAFYSHYRARRMMAEQLMDAIGAATGRPEKFAGFPASYRAVSLPDPALARAGLLDLFGRPQRASACECERSAQPSLTQTLYLINSEFTHDKITDSGGTVALMVAGGKSDEEIIRRLYAAALTRYPTAAETDQAKHFIGEAENRREGLEDVLWTLLNSQEFLLQH